ncbi:MAG: hypothetical protein HY074_13125 [Deltaproteobacteria bacterium]|nr:hypothetical protein [Deltaproteobacteria bacterium]
MPALLACQTRLYFFPEFLNSGWVAALKEQRIQSVAGGFPGTPLALLPPTMQHRHPKLASALALFSLLFISACAKDSNPTSPSGTGGSTLQTPAAPAPRSKLELPLLSAPEVAAKLATPSLRNTEKAAQFAASLAAHARSPEVVRVVRGKLRQLDTLPDSEKPVFLTLAAENLSVSDTPLFEQALVKALIAPTSDERATIAALAVVARHPSLAASAELRKALADLLARQQPRNLPTVLVRHWLAVATRNVAAAKTADPAGDELLASALVNADLEAHVLLHGLDAERVRGLLDRKKSDISPERLALVRKQLEGGAL